MAQVKGQQKDKDPPTSVTSVYLHVVEDVIQNVRTDFQSEGVDENVLNELQALWELKMMQAGAIQGGQVTEAAAPAPPAPVKGVTAPVTPVHDLNVPYEATEEYQTPTMEILFPPTPQTMTPQPMTPLVMTPTPHPDAMTPQVMTPIMDVPSPALTSTGEPIMYQYMPPGPSDNASGGNGLDLDTKLGRPQPYMQHPSPWMNKPRGVDVNIDMNATYEEGQEEDEYGHGQAPVTKDFFTLSTGKRKREEMTTGPYIQGYNIPQGDGAHYTGPAHQGSSFHSEWAAQRAVGKNPDPRLWTEEVLIADARVASLVGEATTSRCIPQRDGMDDDYDDGVAEEDYNEPGEEEPQPANDAAPKIAKVEPTAGDSDGGEPPLNEDDDDDLDDNDQGDEEPQTDHLVLAQFDKVTRSKNKWKCTLKDGIMHLNNRDILFVKATGEFEF